MLSSSRAAGAGERQAVKSAKQMATTGELQRLGEVAVWFGNLELHVDGAIGELLAVADDDLKRLLQAVTVEMSFEQKVHAFASLLKLRFPEDANDPELKAVIAELFEAQRKSNAVLYCRALIPATAGGG